MDFRLLGDSYVTEEKGGLKKQSLGAMLFADIGNFMRDVVWAPSGLRFRVTTRRRGAQK